jgi:selenocysteine lyase/cysteine desulfurase
MNLEHYFDKFRQQIIGLNHTIDTPYGLNMPIVYADWTASGRNYLPIEQKLSNEIMPYVANTHTETNSTGMAMTHAYHKAKTMIKDHVNANNDDVLISANSGMTGVINKFQRILGFRVHEKYVNKLDLPDDERPVVFVTHMEHHSNQTSWLETIADVKIIPPDENGLVSKLEFRKMLEAYRYKKHKIAAVTSCSNVTGIMTDYHGIAQEIHKVGGLCFVDFACSAPYVDINMHPEEEGAYLDAIYFSPHKFLGGPGSTGILIFNRNLYQNAIPDNPGGGTVDWTNPWGDHKYIDDIETREDGGTPAFLQTMKVALCVKLKEEMGVANIQNREEELLEIIWAGLEDVSNLHILAEQHKSRLGVVSFYIDNLHYNFGVKMLNDKFGIQTRGGCSCAGTYGHYLLNVSEDTSHSITELISHGDCSMKPGWIRMSIHPTMTNNEVEYIVESIKELAISHEDWARDYSIDHSKGIIKHKDLELDNMLKQKFDEILESSTISELQP